MASPETAAPVSAETPSAPSRQRVRTPTVLQMEAVECGAAALSMILSYYGRIVPLEELRSACGVSRDGSKASNLVRAARTYGLEARGYKFENPDQLKTQTFPLIVFWNFNHYLVVEGYDSKRFYLNDPGFGPRTVTVDEFDKSFTGVALMFRAGADFRKGGEERGVWKSLALRLRGCESALSFVVLVSLGLVIPGLVVPAFSKIFVDDFLVSSRADWLKPLLLGMALTALARGALTWLQQQYLARMETKLALTSSSHLFWHVLRLPVVFFMQRFSGEIGSRVLVNDMLAQLISGQLATNILGLITMFFFGMVMFQYSALLAGTSVLIAIFNLVALQIISRKRKDANRRLLQEQGKLMGTTTSGLQMVETLKATGAEDDFFSRWAGYQAKALNAQQNLGVATRFLDVVPAFLTLVNSAAVLGLGGFLVMRGSLSLGMLVAFQTLMASFIEPVNRLVLLGSSLQIVEGGLKRLDDVLQYPLDPQTAIPALSESSGKKVFKLTGHLELRDVTFAYSRLDAPLIENFSLTLHPGERVALVGPTGCGKSTISKLVSGLVEPWSGQILFDGRTREEIPRAVLANSVALVDQEIFLFEGTIRENLALWDATAPEAAIVQAAKDACIHDEIAERPESYEASVEEAGRNFSGGQRQRLEIGRALVNNPTILIMDEATSALDSKTEKQIDENLRRRGCTCLIIAHRLSTIRDCDEIIVLDRGKVIQRGTHETLVSEPGLYADLIRA